MKCLLGGLWKSDLVPMLMEVLLGWVDFEGELTASQVNNNGWDSPHSLIKTLFEDNWLLAFQVIRRAAYQYDCFRFQKRHAIRETGSFEL